MNYVLDCIDPFLKNNEYIQQHELLHPVLLRFQQREWDRIGAMLLDMCCAGKEAFV